MAYDYNKAKEAYQSLTKEQQQQFVDQNKNDANFQRFMKDYVSEVNQNMSARQSANNTPVTQPTEQPTQQLAQTTPEMKQETEIKQAETVGDTVPEIQQQGALKPLSQDYYNQTSQEAQSKIINNLNNYRQTNPEYFRDYESFKKNFSYDARNDEQKQTLDSWYGGYQKWMELAWVPVTDLYTQYKDGQVSMNELENLRVYDPTKYAELQNQINKWNIIAAYDDDKGQDAAWKSIQDMAYDMAVQTFTKFMNGDWASEATQFFRDYESKMESPEMLALSDQCTEVQEQMENIQSDLDSIKKQVEAEYEWTWATRSKINAIIADRSYDLQLQLRTLNSEYNKYATQYNNRMQQYQNEFSMQLQEYQLNQQARNQQMQELWFAMDLMNFETNEQKAQREWDYWVKQQEYTNWNINSSDYQTRYKAALKSVQNLLSQYEWIPMQRSAEQMAQDILTAIDWGSDLGAELTKINQQIQGKPEYKMLYNQTYRNPDAWFTESFTVWDTQYVKYNGQRYTADELNNKMWNWAIWNPKPYDAVSEEMFSIDPSKWGLGAFLLDSKNANGKKWWQCAKFVNDYLQQIGVGRYFWNEDIKTRQQWANSNTPKVWSIAIFDYGHTSSDWINHGHVAIVTQVNKDGSFVVKESNFPSWETIWTRTIQPWGTSLKWFFDPSKWAVSVSENVNTEVSNLPWWLTATWVTQLAKDILNWEKTYSEIKAAYGDEWLNIVENKMLELQSSWFEKSTKITDPVKLSNLEKNWRDFYDKKAKEAQETLDWVNKMEEAYNLIDTDKNAASQAITIAYNKILDPGSVVREWEYARSAEWQSYLSQIQAKLEKMKDWWAWLTKKELESMINVAKKFSQNAEKIQLDAAKQTKVAIDKYWLTPEIALPVDIWNKISSWEDLNSNTPQTTKQVNALDVVKSSLSKMSKNIQQSTPSTKATLQSKYWINN